ncbi:MAG: hypothetical protein FJ290_24365 [Planctomycetes bacterium]|nr:hypothetical protein [Planctomycetota bacterium]
MPGVPGGGNPRPGPPARRPPLAGGGRRGRRSARAAPGRAGLAGPRGRQRPARRGRGGAFLPAARGTGAGRALGRAGLAEARDGDGACEGNCPSGARGPHAGALGPSRDTSAGDPRAAQACRSREL